MRMQIIKKSILIAILIITVLASALVPLAYSLDSGVKFDDTKVMDDLFSSTNGNNSFNIGDYPFDHDNGTPRIMNFVEYCYTMYSDEIGNFGLYVYVYNPSGGELKTTNANVQMAIEHKEAINPDKKDIAPYVPTKYAKFDLQFCNKSEGQYNNLFYKFKIINNSIDGLQLHERVNSNERQYDISGIELDYVDDTAGLIEYTVGGSYLFTGFVKGYGLDPESDNTLKCRVYELETIKLDVKSTFYRPNGENSNGKYHQDQLSSVYFAVPDDILAKYGRLHEVRAEWYEYQSAPIIVTNNRDAYDWTTGKLGKIMSDTINIGGGYGYHSATSSVAGSSYYLFAWNVASTESSGHIANKYNQLTSIFYQDVKDIMDYALPSDRILNHYKNYDKSYVNGKILDKYSADLFTNKVDPGRTRGYNVADINNGVSFSLDKIPVKNGWEEFWGISQSNSMIENINPIRQVSKADVGMDDYDLSTKHFIYENDISNFRSYCNNAYSNKSTPYLFSFAVTDYFCPTVYIHDYGKHLAIPNDKHAYMAQQTVFLEFDILQLTFNKDGKYNAIACVSNPIDVVASLTPPPQVEGNDWWEIIKLILVLILVILLLVIFAPLWIPLVKGLVSIVVYVLKLPFKLIGAIGKGAKGDKK